MVIVVILFFLCIFILFVLFYLNVVIVCGCHGLGFFLVSVWWVWLFVHFGGLSAYIYIL